MRRITARVPDLCKLNRRLAVENQIYECKRLSGQALHLSWLDYVASNLHLNKNGLRRDELREHNHYHSNTKLLYATNISSVGRTLLKQAQKFQ